MQALVVPPSFKIHICNPVCVCLTVQALASLGDGSLANGVGVTVHVATNNGANVIFNDVITSVGGAINAVISVPLDTNCMKISVSSMSKLVNSSLVQIVL